ncbi:Glycosyltransferases involved in cell wall biogenesis [Minicystis rosea]|nr:Glycosyltransferases involved in cell wall biogenesis [Minicystis rosea]
MRACALIPAYDAERTIGDVVREVLRVWPERGGVFVVDDGSRDGTAKVAREAGARVIAHPRNRGKGAALRTGMEAAWLAGFDVVVTIDADGQHPAREAVRLIEADPDAHALVLGIRDLVRDGAPRASQMSNRISNFFLSVFSRRALADTQCGLRRYPLPLALDLGGRDDGYAFEAEIILRSIAAGARLVEVPVRVFYPPPEERLTHFDSVRDPARIIVRVVKTLALTAGLQRSPERRRAPAPPVSTRPRPAPPPSSPGVSAG